MTQRQKRGLMHYNKESAKDDKFDKKFHNLNNTLIQAGLKQKPGVSFMY